MYISVGSAENAEKHTAENMAQAKKNNKKNLMEDWAIADKLTCLVTDAVTTDCMCQKTPNIFFILPCERAFSKAGEMVSKWRNRLGPKMLKQLMFLNKNL